MATMAAPVGAQTELPLYAGEIPHAIAAPDEEKIRDPAEPHPFLMNVSRPTLTAYLPKVPDANRAAVVVLPGGGYRGVSIMKEGHAVARAFNEMGVVAFVVKYRTPSAAHMADPARGPLQDAQQAIHTVRERASEWHIDPARIGVIGFSAGGHLAATAATRFAHPLLPGMRPAEIRPDFLILIYPVISFSEALGHAGSRQMLLGPSPAEEQVRWYSAELAVAPDTPRTFLMHAADDTVVPVGNSIRFFEALQAVNVPAQLLVYPGGGHGFGLDNPKTTDRWMDRVRAWLHSEGWLAAQQGSE